MFFNWFVTNIFREKIMQNKTYTIKTLAYLEINRVIGKGKCFCQCYRITRYITISAMKVRWVETNPDCQALCKTILYQNQKTLPYSMYKCSPYYDDYGFLYYI